MARLTPTSGGRWHPLAVLPSLAVLAAIVGLLDHPVGALAAVLAALGMLLAVVTRLVLVVMTWRWTEDRRFLLAAGALVLVIAAGTVLGRVR